MKKLLIIPLLCLTLTGCSKPSNIEDGLRWIEVVDKDGDCTIVRHRQTGVCYMISRTGIIMLVNGDGTPYKIEMHNRQ